VLKVQRRNDESGRLEVQVMPAPELSEERVLPTLWGL